MSLQMRGENGVPLGSLYWVGYYTKRIRGNSSAIAQTNENTMPKKDDRSEHINKSPVALHFQLAFVFEDSQGTVQNAVHKWGPATIPPCLYSVQNRNEEQTIWDNF